MKRRNRSIGALLLLSGILTACQLGPHDPVREYPIEEYWETELSFPATPCPPLAEWWKQFDDPCLDSLIDTLVCANYDLRIAIEKVTEARWRLCETGAALFPQISQSTREDHATPTAPFGGASGGGVASPFKFSQTQKLSVFRAAWEIDLFGRLARSRDSAALAARVSLWDARGIQVSLIADLVAIYTSYRGVNTILETLEEERALVQSKLSLTQQRVERGIDDRQQLDKVEIERASIDAEIAQLRAEISVRRYQLSQLIGAQPNCLRHLDAQRLPLFEIHDAIAVGIPSTLTRRRPDIRRAECLYAKANADLGVAIADRFPHLTLTGSWGYMFLKLGKLAWDGMTWSYAGELLTDLFDGGRKKARIGEGESLRRQSSLNYERTVLNALTEAESALAGFQGAFQVEQEARRVYTLQKESEALALQKQERGVLASLQTIDPRQKSLQAKRRLIEAQIDSRNRVVDLYRALGGGWSEPCGG
ncbi:MAG: efflux transporter outer membrane subunit [Chlamydiia bacterium]|nr:efflux transporter outer membrane subunit [Chlamydiia bacterium]